MSKIRFTRDVDDVVFPGDIGETIQSIANSDISAEDIIGNPTTIEEFKDRLSHPEVPEYAYFSTAMLVTCAVYSEPGAIDNRHTGNMFAIKLAGGGNIRVDGDHPIKSGGLSLGRPDDGWTDYAD